MKFRVCVALANRTNYSKLKGIIRELKNRDEIDLKVITSSTMLLEKYGKSYLDLEKDGVEVDKKLDCILMNDSHEAMAKTMGLSMIEHSTYFGEVKPDLFLIVGDRFDILAPVTVASMMNIPIAHIQGGELSGTIDNTIRDIISKYSQLHFVSTDQSKLRLENIGINSETIFNYGCPAVELVNSIELYPNFSGEDLKKKFLRKIDIKDGEPYILLMAHPDTTVKNDLDMDLILSVLEKSNRKVFVFYPNADATNSEILADISKHKEYKNFYMIRHMPVTDFINVMAHAEIMIGNSSAGIREAASFGVPVINIGHRQNHRERNKNTFDIPCTREALERTIEQCKELKFPKENIYFQEDCTKNIVNKIIENLQSRRNS